MEQHANFFDDVYEVVKLVPPGRVTTYGAIAHYLGTRGSARMVGWAMNASHAPARSSGAQGGEPNRVAYR